jgi:hypothetical protein
VEPARTHPLRRSSVCASLHVGPRVEPLTSPAEALPLETTHDERVVGHRFGLLEELAELRIVLVDRTLESRADRTGLRVVERPERALELQHRLVPFADHPHMLAVEPGDLQASPGNRRWRP